MNTLLCFGLQNPGRREIGNGCRALGGCRLFKPNDFGKFCDGALAGKFAVADRRALHCAT
jgi:hypothetical protein